MTIISASISYDANSLTYTIKPGAATKDVQSLLANAVANTTFYFTEGVHVFSDTLELKTGNVTIKGAGADKTTFLFDMSQAGDALHVAGSYGNWTGQLASDSFRDDHTIVLKSAAGLKAGDVLHIQQQNTDQWLTKNGYENVVGTSYQASQPINETLVEIQSISGNVVTLKTPITHDMESDVTTIKSVNMLKNVHLSDFTLTYDLGTPNPDSFTSALPDYLGTISISLEKTYQAEVNNVSVVNAPSHSMEVRTSLMPGVDHFSANGAFNKDGTGDGYGLQIAETYYGKFDNLNIQNTRHAVVFSSWHTEVGNVVHVVSTNRDINFHGGPDYDNVVTVDRDLYRSGDTIWRIVSPGGDQHPYTDIYGDNTVVFGVAQGGNKVDEIYGWSKGSWLDGKEGNDIIHGGTGSDIIIGGKGYDDLYGGSGADTFAFLRGDGRDDIWDFEVSKDRLAFDGFSGISSVADLDISYSDLGAQIVVAGEKIATLSNVKSGQLTAQNFVFNNHSFYTPPSAVDLPPPPPPPPVIPDPVAGQTYSVSSKVETINGTAGDDLVQGYTGQFNAGDVIKMGAGQDTMKILSTSGTVDTRLYSGYSGIDRIDMTKAGAAGKVIIDKAFLQSTDHETLTVDFGAGKGTIDVSSLKAGEYSLSWSGNVATVHSIDVSTPPPPPSPTLPPDPSVSLTGTSRADILSGGSGADTLDGAGGADTLYGHAGADFLYGGTGMDVLVGGEGTDTLSGGGGNDVFRYDNIQEGGDLIIDFRPNDYLDLTGLLTHNGLAGETVPDLLQTGHIQLMQSGANLVVSFDVDGTAGSQAARIVATLQNASEVNILVTDLLI